MDVSIRSARPDDYASALPLFRQVHELHVRERPDLYKENPTPVGKQDFESRLDDGAHRIFVAAAGAQIVGIVVTKEEDIPENSFVKARKVLLVDSLCVSETYRNQGVGKKLMRYVIDFGRSLGVDSVELGVSERNAAAILFYESIGMTTKHRKMELKTNETVI
jgi:ribosomal protein S18 acetylase RimI-like enzyme